MLSIFNTLDFGFSAVLGMTMLVGGLRGLSRMLLSWGMWLSSAYVLYYHSTDLASIPGLDHYFTSDILQFGVVCSSVVVLTFLASAVSQMFMGRCIHVMGLYFVDKFLGLYFGLAQGILLISFVILSFANTPFSQDPWWHSSFFVGATMQYAPVYSNAYVQFVQGFTNQVDKELLPKAEFLLKHGEQAQGTVDAVAKYQGVADQAQSMLDSVSTEVPLSSPEQIEQETK